MNDRIVSTKDHIMKLSRLISACQELLSVLSEDSPLHRRVVAKKNIQQKALHSVLTCLEFRDRVNELHQCSSLATFIDELEALRKSVHVRDVTISHQEPKKKELKKEPLADIAQQDPTAMVNVLMKGLKKNLGIQGVQITQDNYQMIADTFNIADVFSKTQYIQMRVPALIEKHSIEIGNDPRYPRRALDRLQTVKKRLELKREQSSAVLNVVNKALFPVIQHMNDVVKQHDFFLTEANVGEFINRYIYSSNIKDPRCIAREKLILSYLEYILAYDLFSLVPKHPKIQDPISRQFISFAASLSQRISKAQINTSQNEASRTPTLAQPESITIDEAEDLIENVRKCVDTWNFADFPMAKNICEHLLKVPLLSPRQRTYVQHTLASLTAVLEDIDKQKSWASRNPLWKSDDRRDVSASTSDIDFMTGKHKLDDIFW